MEPIFVRWHFYYTMVTRPVQLKTMANSSHTPFTTIHTEGALLPVDLLQRIAAGDPALGGLDPDSYHLPGSEKLNEAVNRSWNRLLGAWASFQTSRGRLGAGDAGTTLTRERWLMPLFQELGYGRLQAAKAVTLEGKEYRVSHAWGEVPIHLVGCGVSLDRRQAGVTGAAKSSPHSLVQEYLNRDPNQLWGLLSNGLTLRVLRDNASLTRQAYLEFDLEAMMTGEVYADFVLLWLVCHQSRVEVNRERRMVRDAEDTPTPLTSSHSSLADCWLEKWSKAAQEQGTRALDKLRDGVEQAITALGGGFLAHPGNSALKARLRSGALTREGYYRQLLRLVYRLIFLFAAEDRDLLLDPQASPAARERYLKYYSAARLRHLAEQSRGGRHPDLYAVLRLVSAILGGREPGAAGRKGLGLPVLGSFLFSAEALPDLETAELENGALLSAVRGLAFVLEGNTRRAVDYRNLGTRELGSVYESLLELHPQINLDAGTFQLSSAAGNERKTTGSYYTPEDLINVLLDSALDPVIQQALKRAERVASGEWRMVNGEWQAVNGEWTEEEKQYANSVLPGFRGMAAGNAVGGKNLLPDSLISEGGNVWPDQPDAPGSRVDTRQYRGGMGEVGDKGVSTLFKHRDGQPARTGNAPDPLSTGRILPEGGGGTTFADNLLPGKTDSNPSAQPGEADRLAADFWNKTPLAIRRSLLAVFALLSLKVCDPACGSGHFLIAAARRIARRLAQLRSGDEEPSPEITRSALREVIQHCVYGVDINPMSVELCKVNLWLESIEPGKPLSFLDAHIQCGDSLVGVGAGLDITEIPDEAFSPAFGDDKATAAALKKRNKAERAGQMGLDIYVIEDEEDLQAWMARRAQALDELPEETAEQVGQKEQSHQDYLASPQYRRKKLEYDLWTAAFFWKMEAQPGSAGILAPTQEMLRRHRAGGTLPPELLRRVEALAERLNFLHWELRFPKVFAGDNPGFDCVLGNPPWERIKLQEEEFFAALDPHIAAAPNKAARQKLINELAQTNPSLAAAFQNAKHAAECTSKFVRASQRYRLTAVGDVNTYALFAEHFRGLMNRAGQAGVIVPTGIATDDTTKDFFGDLVEKRAIASLLDFENREALFPGVHRSYKFCLLTLSGAPTRQAQFVFFATRVEHLRDERRRFSLDPAEIALFNPNTRTMPVFRTRADAELTRQVYQRVPVLVNERTGDNPWGIRIKRVFDMNKNETLSIVSTEEKPQWVKIYEAKMIWQYDYRFGTYDGINNRNSTKIEQFSIIDYNQPSKSSKPWYWISKEKVLQTLKDWERFWILGYRDITNSTNERTVISTIIPFCGTDFTIRVLFSSQSTVLILCLLASLNSIVLDYIARQAVAGTHLSDYITKQLTFITPEKYSSEDVNFILIRVIELTYTAYDLQPFAQDILNEIGEDTWNTWFPHSPLSSSHSPLPFPWDEDRRATLRAELDAYYARLYGLNRKQLRYILDPADLTEREIDDILDPWEEVSDPLDPAGYEARRAASDFPGETFRVLKDKEMRLYGEYRTRRLVLEAWERLGSGELGVVSGELGVVSGELGVEHGELGVERGGEAVREEPEVKREPAVKAQEEPPLQPALSDFGLYKCGACGKMVMGFEKESHEREKHRSQAVGWKKMR